MIIVAAAVVVRTFYRVQQTDDKIIATEESAKY